MLCHTTLIMCVCITVVRAVCCMQVESLTAARNAAQAGTEPSDAIRVVNAVLTQLDQIKRLVTCGASVQTLYRPPLIGLQISHHDNITIIWCMYNNQQSFRCQV